MIMNEEVYETYHSKKKLLYRKIKLGSFTSENTLSASTNATDDKHDSPVSDWWQSYLRGGIPSPTNTNSRVMNIVDLFCGCGGLSFGVKEILQAVGLNSRVLVAVDNEAGTLEVYKHNLLPEIALVQNVNSLIDFQIRGRDDTAEFGYEPEFIEPSLARLRDKVDILIAGPPCQGHSNLNNHTRREDPRNLLYQSVVAAAVALSAKAVVIENVPEIVNDKRGIIRTAKTLFEKAGYAVDMGVLNASELGCAQKRRRHFLVACNTCKKMPVSLNEISKVLSKPSLPIEWAIADLLDIDDESIFDSAPTLSLENQKRIDYLFDNNIYDLPNSIRPDCHKNGHTYPSVYGRLKWDEPSPTITTGFMSPGRGRYVHPLKRRVLTPHEAARLQGFPDSYRFIIDPNVKTHRTALATWIGDAVPPILGYAAGALVLTGLSYE